MLYGTLATTVPFYNISTICNRNKKQIYKFSASSKSRMQRFEEPHAAREPQFAFGHPCSTAVVLKVWIATQTGVVECQKLGRAEAIQTWVVYFQRYRCLSMSVCSVDTWEASRFLTLKTNLATYCQNSSIQSLFSSYAVWGSGRKVFTTLIWVALKKACEPLFSKINRMKPALTFMS